MAWTNNSANSCQAFFSSCDKREDALVCEEQLVSKGLEEMWHDAQKLEGWTDGGRIWNFLTAVQSFGCSNHFQDILSFLVTANLLHWRKSGSCRWCPWGTKKLLPLRTLSQLQWNVPVPIAIWSARTLWVQAWLPSITECLKLWPCFFCNIKFYFSVSKTHLFHAASPATVVSPWRAGGWGVASAEREPVDCSDTPWTRHRKASRQAWTWSEQQLAQMVHWRKKSGVGRLKLVISLSVCSMRLVPLCFGIRFH